MAVEASISKYKRNNSKIIIAVLLGLAAWCVYDGYLNAEFEKEHTENYGTEQAKPGTYLVFNRGAPFFLMAGAAAMLVSFFLTKDKKVIADERQLMAEGRVVPYDTIESIDKTHFETKGYFVITYKDGASSKTLRLSSGKYDNLKAILDETVAKIT